MNNLQRISEYVGIYYAITDALLSLLKIRPVREREMNECTGNCKCQEHYSVYSVL